MGYDKGLITNTVQLYNDSSTFKLVSTFTYKYITALLYIYTELVDNRTVDKYH